MAVRAAAVEADSTEVVVAQLPTVEAVVAALMVAADITNSIIH